MGIIGKWNMRERLLSGKKENKMQQEKMRNIKLSIEYDGSRYAGWQKMPGKDRMVTIQGKLEEVLEKMEGKPRMGQQIAQGK